MGNPNLAFGADADADGGADAGAGAEPNAPTGAVGMIAILFQPFRVLAVDPLLLP